jgi:P2 family phage contractile tail tube protein
MALPRKLKLFNVFLDGTEFLGVATEVQLPKLARKMLEYRAGDMNGSIDIDACSEKLELKMGGFVQEMFATWASPKHDAAIVRFAGSYQRDDTGDVGSVEVYVRGRYSEIDPGSGKAGEDTEQNGKMTLSYYRLTLNGRTLVEIDLPGLKEIVNGEDRLKAQHRAIGL